MRRTIAVAVICFVAVMMTASAATADGADEYSYVSKSISSMPLAFTENTGQWDEQVRFCANAGGSTMWFTHDGAYYQFTRRVEDTDDISSALTDRSRGMRLPDRKTNQYETMTIKASFAGANLDPRVIGAEMIECKCNYFIGNDPDQWLTDVPNYRALVYEGIYDGIDLKYYGNGTQMEYDFVISPRGDPSQIIIEYEGVEALSVNDAGELVVETEWCEVIEHRPVVYQVDNGIRVSLVGEYLLKGNNSFGFALPNGYNADLALIIDPVIEYSTYLGGGSTDRGYGIAVDDAGCAYVTGSTLSSDFPTESPFQTYQGFYDVFVTKLSSSGNALIYSTYLGAESGDVGNGIAVDQSGCAYVMGRTESSDFPTQNPFQTYQGSHDVFITKLSGDGSSLIYSTYLGGTDADYYRGIAVDEAGCAYVTGSTYSPHFPTENPYQLDQPWSDVFVTRLSSHGSSLVYSTYLGGGQPDEARNIAVDSTGCAYVTGRTASSDFPTENPDVPPVVVPLVKLVFS